MSDSIYYYWKDSFAPPPAGGYAQNDSTLGLAKLMINILKTPVIPNVARNLFEFNKQ